jgi:hypothetical protein
MGILANRGTFLAALAAIVGLSIGSLAFTQTASFGAETDGSETDAAVASPDVPIYGGSIVSGANFPVVGGSPSAGLPPAAPVAGGGGSGGGGGNTGGVGGGANTLPSTGSGGYLDSSSSSLPYAFVAFAVALALTGSLAWVHSRR